VVPGGHTVQRSVDTQWSTLYDEGHDFRIATSQEISKFLSFVDPAAPKTVLDIGCGTGQLTRELYHRGYKTVGIDTATSAIQIAQSLTVVPPDRLSYVRFDIEHDDLSKLPYVPYSLIVCKLVYAFITDKPSFLERVRHLLASGGLFIVITPLAEDVPPKKLFIATTTEDMKQLASSFDELARYHENGQTYFVGRK
jgi:SAM-dependent methyltransferase